MCVSLYCYLRTGITALKQNPCTFVFYGIMATHNYKAHVYLLNKENSIEKTKQTEHSLSPCSTKWAQRHCQSNRVTKRMGYTVRNDRVDDDKHS